MAVVFSQSDLHDLFQCLVAGSQFSHGECGGDTDGGHEDVGLGGLAEGQLFVQREGEAAVGLRQLPHSGVGGLGDHLGLLGQSRAHVGAAVDAARLQRELLRFCAADVWMDSKRDERQEHQDTQPIRSPHPAETTHL